MCIRDRAYVYPIPRVLQPAGDVPDGAPDAVEVGRVVRALQAGVPGGFFFRRHCGIPLRRQPLHLVRVGLRAVGNEVEQPVVQRDGGRVRPPCCLLYTSRCV